MLPLALLIVAGTTLAAVRCRCRCARRRTRPAKVVRYPPTEAARPPVVFGGAAAGAQLASTPPTSTTPSTRNALETILKSPLPLL